MRKALQTVWKSQKSENNNEYNMMTINFVKKKKEKHSEDFLTGRISKTGNGLLAHDVESSKSKKRSTDMTLIGILPW